MRDLAPWLAQLFASNAPALPPGWAMQLAATLGWSLVLALLGCVLGRSLALRSRGLLAAGLALWTWLPGVWSPDYWLGLAFQAPSLTAVLLCLVYLWRPFRSTGAAAALPQAAAVRAVRPSLGGWLLPGLAVVLGYALLLDTFAVLPLELYAWGFSPALLLGLLALSLLPWALRSRSATLARPLTHCVYWVTPTALLLFAATRLPTGNVWDALLDPWLWLVLHIALLAHLLRAWRARR